MNASHPLHHPLPDALLERFLNPLPEDFKLACEEWRGLNEESEDYAKGYARAIVKRTIDARVGAVVDENASLRTQLAASDARITELTTGDPVQLAMCGVKDGGIPVRRIGTFAVHLETKHRVAAVEAAIEQAATKARTESDARVAAAERRGAERGAAGMWSHEHDVGAMPTGTETYMREQAVYRVLAALFPAPAVPAREGQE